MEQGQVERRFETADRVSGANAGTAGCDAKAACPPRWESLPIEQKIERLRDALRITADQQAVIGAIAVTANNLVRSHGHGPQGVMKPVHDWVNEPGYGSRPMDVVKDLLR